MPLCKQLQSKDIDLKEMVGLAEDNVNALKQLRANIEIEFKNIFNEAQVINIFIFYFYIDNNCF